MRVTADPTALLTPQGRELLARLETSPASMAGNQLALAERLRRVYPADLVALAMAQQELRRAAEAKFSRAADMLFTRAGYEQSSSEAIARYRAARLADALGHGSARDTARVADLCCGIGGDLIALAAGAQVLAVDRDETHARLALHNAAVYDEADRVTTLVSDVRDVPLAGIDAVFIDPARRTGPGTASAADSRRFRAGLSEPPLDWCAALTETVPAVYVKAAPGIPEELIPPGWEAEFIAEGRDLKEAVLWSPALAPDRPAAPIDDQPAARRATVLAATAPERPAHADTLLPQPGDPVPLREPGEYLLDPNPAVTRASLVEDLARDLSAKTGSEMAKIDPQIAFLTLDRPVATPFARTLRVLHSAPWHEKQFAKRMRDLGIGAVDIRRRGLAGDVDQIRRRLKLSGSIRATLVITRVNNHPWGLICTDPSPQW
jgi:SAM-dependent methyltransferase